MQSGNLAQSADCMPCSLQTARPLHARVCFGEITSKKTERIVMIYSVVLCEKLGGHFGSRESSSSQQPFIPCEQRKLSLFPPITSKKTKNNHCQKDRGYFPLG